jgi:hypothetical protein
MAAVTKFPRNPINGQLFVDTNGIEWRYQSGSIRWVQNELNELIPLASPVQDGLITPVIYNKLVTLQDSLQGLDVSVFKIAPGTDAYYYYFYSPDGLIDIRYRGNGEINIDVNEQKLVAYYYRYLCIGDRGPQGEQGPDGEVGIPAPNEATYYPFKVNDVVTGQAYVPIPIGTYFNHPTITPISLRFFGFYEIPGSFSFGDQLVYWIDVIDSPFAADEEKTVFSRLRQQIIDQSLGLTTGPNIALSQTVTNSLNLVPNVIFQLDINPVDGSFEIVVNGIGANPDDIVIEFDQNIGLLKFEISGGWPEETVWKARQRGLTGDRGDIPDGFIRTEPCEFPDDSNVRPDGTLTHFRLDCENDTFYVNYTRLVSQDAFQLITTDILAGATTTRPMVEGRYVAVERVATAIKKTTPLSNAFPEVEVEDPDLQQWEPQDGCFTRRSFEKHEFDWISGTDAAACSEDLKWYGPEGVRPGRYPYELVRPKEPTGDECCQDDYFIFPESGEC